MEWKRQVKVNECTYTGEYDEHSGFSVYMRHESIPVTIWLGSFKSQDKADNFFDALPE